MNRRIEPSLGPPSASGPPRVERRRPRSYDDGMVSLIPRVLLTTIFTPVLLLLAVIGGLRWIPPPTSAYMLQSPVKPVQYHWVPAGSIAEVARRAVVASEDQKFWTHRGFDVEAIEKAEQYNKNPRHHRRGASTISQQTAKNLFLWPEGGYFRKAIEAGITILLEHLWNKDRILEVYLNIAEFGPGIYGVEAASQAYFHKPAARLSTEEAATLAAVLPNPRRWSARSPGPYVQSRAAWIMGQMGYGHAPSEEPLPPPGLEPDEDGAASSAPATVEDSGQPEPPAEPSATPAEPAPSADNSAPVQQAPSN